MSIYGLYERIYSNEIKISNFSANSIADPEELKKLAVLPMLRALVLLGEFI